jgi:hypothetical protein
VLKAIDLHQFAQAIMRQLGACAMRRRSVIFGDAEAARIKKARAQRQDAKLAFTARRQRDASNDRRSPRLGETFVIGSA